MSEAGWSAGALRISRRAMLAGVGALGAGLALDACSGGNSQQGTASGPQTVEMWIWETVKQWDQVFTKSGLHQKFPNVTMKVTAMTTDQIQQKALTALGAGVASGLPSIIRISMDMYRSLVQTNALTDFTDIVTKHKSEILPDVYDGLMVNGKAFAAPDDTGVMLFGYREDIFKKAGLPTKPDEVESQIKTYDDLLATGSKLAAVGAKLFNDNAGGMFANLILQDTTGYFDKDGNVIFDSAQHITCAEVAKKFYDSGHLTSFEDNSPQMWGAYKSDKLATMFYPNWQDFIVLQNAPETKGKWGVFKLPSVVPGGKRASSADGCALIVPSVLDDSQRKLAMNIVEFLKLNKKAQVAHMTVFDGAFCSYEPALEAMAKVKSPVLNNQYTYQLDLDAAKQEQILPNYRTSIFMSNAQQAATDALFKICKNNAPIPATLKQAADSIRKMQDQRGAK